MYWEQKVGKTRRNKRHKSKKKLTIVAMGFHQINNMANILEKKSCNEVHFFFSSK